MNKIYESKVCEFYNQFEEDKRISKDKAHMIEYHTTMRYIKKYLYNSSNVIDIGCGTGIYSIDIARMNHNVTAVDLSQSNLDVLKSRVKNNPRIKTLRLNALDLSKINSSSFDLTLLLGAVYNLIDKSNVDKVLKEAKRVTKPDGYLFIGFLSKDYIIMRNCNTVFKEENKDIDKLISNYSEPNGIFNYMTINEMKILIKINKLNLIHLVSSDGIVQFLENQ
jgi:ubiquinone/menaquinone biosynthesis C-methylase UbiE